MFRGSCFEKNHIENLLAEKLNKRHLSVEIPLLRQVFLFPVPALGRRLKHLFMSKRAGALRTSSRRLLLDGAA